MRTLLCVIAMIFTSKANAWTPLLPKTTKASASLQTVSHDFESRGQKFRVQGLGGHFSLKAPVTENLAVGISAGHSTNTSLRGPFDADGKYGVRIAIQAEAGAPVYEHLEAFGLINYSQDSWQFERPLVSDRNLIIELDSKILAGGVGLRYRIDKVAIYTTVEKILTENHVGDARFTPLGGNFSYTLAHKQRAKSGVELRLTDKVDLRYEHYWHGDGSWALAADVSL